MGQSQDGSGSWKSHLLLLKRSRKRKGLWQAAQGLRTRHRNSVKGIRKRPEREKEDKE